MLTTEARIDSDHLGTLRVITDGSNQIVWRWDNAEPFGNAPANADPNATGTAFPFNLRFPGQYADSESNTHYAYFRDGLDPLTGRFTQSDPIGLAGGSLSPYAFVNNNPLSYTDPEGLAGTVPSNQMMGVQPNWQPQRIQMPQPGQNCQAPSPNYCGSGFTVPNTFPGGVSINAAMSIA